MSEERASRNEEKKEYLKGYERAVRQVNRLELSIAEIRGNKMFPSANNDGSVRSSGNNDLSSYAARLDMEERKYMKARYRRIQLCKEIINRIERLKREDEKDVLAYRYIKLMKWEDICVKMHVSWKQVHRIHARALTHFEMEDTI